MKSSSFTKKFGIKLRILAAVLILTTVGSGLCLSIHAEDTSMKKVTSLFPRLYGAWVGDVMPMTDGDQLRLYYLYDLDANSWPMHPFFSFTTDNFYEYYYQDNVGVYGSTNPADQDHLGLGTGSVILGKDGLYHCFYTGVNTLLEGQTTAIMHATSPDQITWTKIPEDTIYPPEGYNKEDYRDSEVMWCEEAGEYWMTVSGRCVTEATGTEQGVVLLYTSDDLKNWEFKGNLFEPNHQYMLECSDILRIGDRYYLFYSWNCITYYAVSDSIYGPYTDPADNVLSSDSFTFYAAKAGTLNGKNYLCAWLGRKRNMKDSGIYDWGGNLVVFEIHQKADGTLALDMPTTYYEYFNKTYGFVPVRQTGNVTQAGNSLTLRQDAANGNAYVSMGLLPETMMMTCTVTVDHYFTQGGLAFGSNGVNGDSMYIMINAQNSRVQFDGNTIDNAGASVAERVGSKVSFQFEPGKEYTLKVVVENEIIALYINGEKTTINRVYCAEGMDWGFFASNKGITFSDIEIKVTDAVTTQPGDESEKEDQGITGEPIDPDDDDDVIIMPPPGGEDTDAPTTDAPASTTEPANDTTAEPPQSDTQEGEPNTGGCRSLLKFGTAAVMAAGLVLAGVLLICKKRKKPPMTP